MPYPLQTPVGSDGEVVVGPDGRPLYYPHFQVPGFVTFGTADARALGVYAFLRAFVNETEGELVSNVTTKDIADRFGVSQQVVSRKGGRRGNPPGLVQRLEAASALHVHRRWKKTRPCASCGAPVEVGCPSTCTETKGRVRAAPRYELAAAPVGGFLNEGPLDRWEYHNPGKIAKRLRQEGPDSKLPPEERRQVLPFNQAMSWVAFYPKVELEHLGVYVFIAAHTSMAEGQLNTGDRLFREIIARRFDMSVSTVSEITRHLEHVGVISKTGLHRDGQGRRFGASSEPTGYMLRVSPPAGLRHPLPLHVGEWRDPERITQRLELMLSDGTLQFAHIPSDLRNVDNSVMEESSTGGWCAPRREWTCAPEAVDVQPGDLTTDPALQTPATDPLSSPSVGGQVQDEHAREGSDADGGRGSSEGEVERTDENASHEGDVGLGSPSARPAAVGHRGRHRAPSAVAWDLLDRAEKRLPRSAAGWRSDDDRGRVATEIQHRLEEGWGEADLCRALTWQVGASPAAWGLMARAADPSRWLPSTPPLPADPEPGDMFDRRPEFEVGSDGTATETCPDHPTIRNIPGGSCAVCGLLCRSVPGELMHAAPPPPAPRKTPEPFPTTDALDADDDSAMQTRMGASLHGASPPSPEQFVRPWCGHCVGDASSPRYRMVIDVVGEEQVVRPCPRCGQRTGNREPQGAAR